MSTVGPRVLNKHCDVFIPKKRKYVKVVSQLHSSWKLSEVKSTDEDKYPRIKWEGYSY